ncbi:MAG: hypothetical protein AAFR61_25875 [Bacteroidota bacterium]
MRQINLWMGIFLLVCLGSRAYAQSSMEPVKPAPKPLDQLEASFGQAALNDAQLMAFGKKGQEKIREFAELYAFYSQDDLDAGFKLLLEQRMAAILGKEELGGEAFVAIHKKGWLKAVALDKIPFPESWEQGEAGTYVSLVSVPLTDSDHRIPMQLSLIRKNKQFGDKAERVWVVHLSLKPID